jgi:glycerol-3-phosphate acyltransferase PlsY
VLTAVLVLAGYLSGSITWGYWLVRVFRHEDVRTKGSGNVGASNVWRVYGSRLGLPAMLLDTAKGFVPAFVAVQVVGHGAGVLAGAAAMLGHWRPIFLRFERGGKMVATCGGVFFAVAPLVAVSAGIVWLALFLVFRYASIASILAGIALPVFAVIYGDPIPVVIFGAGAAAGILFLHRGNLRRLRAGTESRFHLRRSHQASA